MSRQRPGELRGMRPRRPRSGLYFCGTDTVNCPTPRKLVFDTQEQAEHAMKYMAYQERRYRPTRAYLCECDHWHLTSISEGTS